MSTNKVDGNKFAFYYLIGIMVVTLLAAIIFGIMQAMR